jgi:hypothetical protein
MVGDAHYYYHHTILTHTRCHVCAMHHHLTCLMKRPTSPSPLLHEYVMKTAPTTWLHDRMSNRGLKPSSPGVQKSSLVAFQKPKITVVMAKDWDIRAEKLVLFGTFTVAFFLNNAYPAPVRDLDCVELWAGVGSIVCCRGLIMQRGVRTGSANAAPCPPWRRMSHGPSLFIIWGSVP